MKQEQDQACPREFKNNYALSEFPNVILFEKKVLVANLSVNIVWSLRSQKVRRAQTEEDGLNIVLASLVCHLYNIQGPQNTHQEEIRT